MNLGYKSIRGEYINEIQMTPRDGPQDWVCYKCNNLNFSFRKKCNRCKIQSREDNEQLFYNDYYYYNQYYHYHNVQTERTQSTPYKSTEHHTHSQVHSPRKSTPKPSKKENDNLPSVSPLLKKYQKSRKSTHRKNEAVKGLWNIVGQELWTSEDFNIDIKSCEIATTDDEESSQFTRCIEQMIL